MLTFELARHAGRICKPPGGTGGRGQTEAEREGGGEEMDFPASHTPRRLGRVGIASAFVGRNRGPTLAGPCDFNRSWQVVSALKLSRHRQ